MVERFLRAEPLPQPLESFIARVPIGGDERFRELRVLHLSVSLSLSLARFYDKKSLLESISRDCCIESSLCARKKNGGGVARGLPFSNSLFAV
jgi:hypothetical protein